MCCDQPRVVYNQKSEEKIPSEEWEEYGRENEEMLKKATEKLKSKFQKQE